MVVLNILHDDTNKQRKRLITKELEQKTQLHLTKDVFTHYVHAYTSDDYRITIQL